MAVDIGYEGVVLEDKAHECILNGLDDVVYVRRCVITEIDD